MDRRRYREFLFDSERWDRLTLREGDIIISTPAKCGTTWTQMLCALLIFRTADLPKPLAVLSPWLDMHLRPVDEVVADLDAQTHRRFIKTHLPLDGLPWDERVTYVHVSRDPRDVAQSWDNHWSNVDFDRFVQIRAEAVGLDDLEELGITGPPPEPPADPVERFWQWVEGSPDAETSSLERLAHHSDTFWSVLDEPNVVVLHYGDLRLDLAGQMARLAGALGLEAPTPDLVEAATFEQMKGRASELVPNSDTSIWKDDSQFFDRARSGDWRELLDADRYRRALEGLECRPEVVRWLHTGWLGTDAPDLWTSSPA